jgi:Glycosyl hydrolase family 10
MRTPRLDRAVLPGRTQLLRVLTLITALIWAPLAAADADHYGVVAAPGLANDPRSADFLQALGVGWARVAFDWPDMEPQRGQIDWGTAERLVQGLKARGLKIYWDFSYAPGWANGRPTNGEDDRSYPPLNQQDLYNFVFTVVGRFKGRVDAWGAWNEPNLPKFYKGSRSRYVGVELQTILRAIAAADPAATVVVGELSSSPNSKPYDWLHDILNSAKGRFSAISHHVYDGEDNCAGRTALVDQLRGKLSEWGYGSYPLWITETGLSESESVKTAYLNCFFPAMHNRGVKTFWYRLEHEPTSRFGLLDGSGLPNQTYQAYERLIRGQATPAPAPRPRDPRGPVERKRPVFRWDEDALGREFRLVVLAGDGSVVIDAVVSGTSYTPAVDLTVGETYTWTITARNAFGEGASSESLSFAPANPPAPPPLPCPPKAAPAATGPSGLIRSSRPTFS